MVRAIGELLRDETLLYEVLLEDLHEDVENSSRERLGPIVRLIADIGHPQIIERHPDLPALGEFPNPRKLV